MNILKRLALKRKKIKVNEIPEDYLEYKSQNTELEKKLSNVSFYYLDSGKKLLSVIKNDDNNILEVLNILNSLDSIFRINFDNLFIRKSDEKLLGFVYPLVNDKEDPQIDINKLIDIIKDSSDSAELCSYLYNKDEYVKDEAKSILINTIFWYKILKYFNFQKISVRNLSYEDLIGYNETYKTKYIHIMNVISKLDILTENESMIFFEEIEIVNICINYFLHASREKVYSEKFNKFIKEFLENYNLYKDLKLYNKSFFENMNFLEIFYEQFKNIIKFDCGHEFDKSFLRCTICNFGDEVLTLSKYNYIFNKKNLVFDDSGFLVYSYLKDSYILIKESEVSNLNIDCIKKYIELKNIPFAKYSYIYDEKSKFIALRLYGTYSRNRNYLKNNIYIEEITQNINEVISKLKNIDEDNNFFKAFCEIFYNIRTQIVELYENGFSLDIKEKFDFNEVLNCFMKVKTNIDRYKDSTFVFVKPYKLNFIENSSYTKNEINEIVVNILFNLIKECCNLNIENDNLINDKFDILVLLNLKVIKEYKKFIKGDKYDSNIVMNCFEEFCLLNASNSNLKFDNSYIVSPILFKSVLDEDIDSRKLKKEYEFKTKKIKNNLELEHLKEIDNSKIDVIIPKYIVYSIENDKVCYKGYWIKKSEKNFVTDVFSQKNLENLDNKQILKMIITYYHYINGVLNYRNPLVKFLCYDSTFSKMFIRYRIVNDKNIFAKEYFFSEIIEKLKEAKIYLSDAIEIIENLDFNNKAENLLTKIYNSFNNYCNIHKCWYEKDLPRCPICTKYYEYVHIHKILKNETVIYENKLYKLFEYKSNKFLKLYKFESEAIFENDKNIVDVESQILNLLKNKVEIEIFHNFSKIVKDINSEKFAGVLISKSGDNFTSVYEFITSNKETNVSCIKLLESLLKNFEKLYVVFANQSLRNEKEIESFLKYHIFYNSKEEKIYILDYEFLFNCRFNLNLEAIRNLNEVIKYIFFNTKSCYDLRTVMFPSIDYDYNQKMLNILSELKKYYSGKNTKICNKHNVLYNEEDGMCPVCMEESDEVWITNPKQKGSEKGFGGEGIIYSLGRSNYIKVYKVNKVSSSNAEIADEVQKVFDEENKQKTLRRMKVLSVTKDLYYLTKNELQDKNFIIAFPKKNVYAGKNKNFIGFVQDKVVDVISFFLFTNLKKCEELGFTTTISLLELLIWYGEGVEYLHNSEAVRKVTPDGIVLGDVSGKNVLYSKYLNKVAIIDMDSVGIKGIPASTLTDDYSDPLTVEGNCIVKKFSFDSDWYSYAIICFYILTKVHPFDGVYDGKYNMTICERKEQKISVVGKYKDKIVLPKVKVDWDWMPDYLINAFVEIFEEEKRYSILDLLKKAYNELSEVKKYNHTNTVEIIEEQTSFQKISKLDKDNTKNAINIELLANLNDILSYKNYSTKLIIKAGNVYYSDKLEENLICDESLKFKSLFYESEYKVINKYLKHLDFDQFYIRDGKGLATVIESGEKFIGLIKNNEFIKIYKISDPNRKFKILHDSINNRYLLISLDNSKSYVVFYNAMLIKNYNEIYQKNINSLEIFDDILFESRVSYIGNAIYYTKNGYICRLDLNSGSQVDIKCPLATRESSVKVFYDAIVVVTAKEIFKINL